MDSGATQPSSDDGVTQPTDRRVARVRLATWIGATLALVALLSGVALALERKRAPCPDGKVFPEGATSFDCYVHPQAELGIAIAALSAVLGILVVFSGILVRASLGERSPAP